MNDKQILAFKELADVMEKHGIKIAGDDSTCISIVGEPDWYTNDEDISAEYLRDALKE